MAEDTMKKENAAEKAAEEQEMEKKEAPQAEENAQAGGKQENSKESKKSRKEKKEEKKVAEDAKKIAELTDNLAKAKEDLDKEKNSYLRLMAEFETFRRRSAEEKLNIVSSAAADTIKGMLPVLDDCERAIKMLEGSPDDAAKEGTLLIYNKLMEYLKGRGLAVIEAGGKVFDTDFHEAVTQFPAPSEDLKGKVIDVVLTGYTLNGKVIRYAKVVVGV